MTNVWETIDFRHELTDMPDRQIDPPDTENMTPDEQREQQAQIIRDMPLEIMADMIADAAGELAPVLSIEYQIQESAGRVEPKEWDAQYLANKLNEIMRPRINDYIEHQLTGK